MNAALDTALAGVLGLLFIALIIVVVFGGLIFWAWIIGLVASIFFGVVWPWWPHKILAGFVCVVILGALKGRSK